MERTGQSGRPLTMNVMRTGGCPFDAEIAKLYGKVVHQVGVIDNVTGLRQVGVMPAARA